MTESLAPYYNENYYESERAYSFGTRYKSMDLLADCLYQQLKPKTTLDAGCAKGYMVTAFMDRGCKAYGCDISEYAIKNSIYTLKMWLKVVDIENDHWPYVDESFDLVTAIECMEHLRKPENAIVEMARVVKPGGYVAIASPRMTLQRKAFRTIYPNPILHQSELSLKEWIVKFCDHGFIYRGDFTQGMSNEWWKEFNEALMNMSLPLPPQILAGKILHGLGLRRLKARLNIWIWLPEFMLFQKVSN